MTKNIAIVATSERPELAETTGVWRWDAFMKSESKTLDEVLEVERQTAIQSPDIPLTLVLLVDRVPAAMASITAHDLDERPDLSPWLAGVFVTPDQRGNGYARQIVQAVEKAASDAGILKLWLYTRNAEGLYAKLGWRTSERFTIGEKNYALMLRELTTANS